MREAVERRGRSKLPPPLLLLDLVPGMMGWGLVSHPWNGKVGSLVQPTLHVQREVM